MAKRKMPIRYVGNRPEFFDYLYGSKETWPQGGVVPVEIPIAIKLLQHPEFEDARDVDEQLAHTPKELLALPADVPDEPGVEEDEKTEEELPEEPPLVNLEALTKDQIAESWAVDRSESGAGSIEVYIHRLRRKLEGSGLAIRTVRGLGYLLEEGDA